MEMINFFESTFILIALMIVGIVYTLYKNRSGKCNLPEPFGLPFLGHLHLMKGNIGQKFTKISERYGDVFKIRIGRQPFVVINGYIANKETITDMSLVFADRPNTFLYNILLAEGLGFIGSWTEKFKQERKAVVRAIASVATLKSEYFQNLVANTCHNVSITLREKYQANFSYPGNDLRNITVFLITKIMFGKLAPDAGDKEYIDFINNLKKWGNEFGIVPIVDFFPGLEWICSKYNFQFIKTLRGYKQYALKQIIKHQNSNVENVPNMLDTLISFYERKDNDLSMNELACNVFIIFSGSIDTITSTSLWFFLLMANHIDIQEHLYQEIENAMGQTEITFHDFNKLPFLQACLFETHRYLSLANIGPFHATSKDIVYKGYVIPKGMGVISNIYSVNYDKTIWDKPEIFNPHRFMKPDGKELNTALAAKILSFGTGRRRCIGENITQLIMFPLMGNIIQNFKLFTDQKLEPSLKNLIYNNQTAPKPCQYGMKVSPRTNKNEKI